MGITSFTAAQVPLRKQWAHSQRTGGEFVAILKRVNIQVKIRPSGPRNQLLLLRLEMEARVVMLTSQLCALNGFTFSTF